MANCVRPTPKRQAGRLVTRKGPVGLGSHEVGYRRSGQSSDRRRGWYHPHSGPRCYPDVSFQLPIVTHVPASYETKSETPIAFTARDTRRSTAHPLRHAVINVIRRIADYRASSLPPEASTSELATSTSSEGDVGGTRNGTNYLLTSLTLFTTHEPCIMCSMALLHSRVKEVIYLLPMEKTGGCGGLACLPTLEGVNHRFGICRWKEVTDNIDMLALDATTDA